MKLGQSGVERVGGDTEIDHGAKEHVAANAGEAIEVENASRGGHGARMDGSFVHVNGSGEKTGFAGWGGGAKGGG